MAQYETSILVEAPLEEVYNQWTQFEEFPRFMEGVAEVRQLDDKRLLWTAEVAGVEREWVAEIVEQMPNRRIAWTSAGEVPNSGAVAFEHRGDATRVTLCLEYEPEGVADKAADALGLVTRRVEGDLARFKRFIEERQQATGAWRGEIHGQEVKKR